VGWGLIVKRDLSEFYAPFHKALVASFCLGLAGVLAVVAMTILVARRVTRPIRALSQQAQEIAANTLASQLPVTSVDEVGVLTGAFNAMIERIRRSQEALVRQERLAALGQLTATVSHELRNPLGTIRTSLFVLAQRLRGKELDVEQILERIERSVTRCNVIISDLLDYSRARPLELEPTDVDAWLEVLLSEQEVPAGITMQRDLASGVRLELDRERFCRCVINVIHNACQAMQPDGGTLCVSSRRQDGRLVIRVSDTGCGIPADQLPQVFEPLYSTKSFGVGLGLCIVKQVVEQHGGGVDIKSQSGRGTTVTLWLPIRENRGEAK